MAQENEEMGCELTRLQQAYEARETAFAEQQVAGKVLRLLLSEVSALTRPRSGMIWVAVLGAGAARNGRYRPEEHARARPPSAASTTTRGYES